MTLEPDYLQPLAQPPVPLRVLVLGSVIVPAAWWVGWRLGWWLMEII